VNEPSVFPSAKRILERCDALARRSESPDQITRLFLSEAQRAASELVGAWMREAGMTVSRDAIGNLIGRYEGATAGLPALLLGSHLDTVRDAGRYDGVLGVVCAIECVDILHRNGVRKPFAIEVIGFADGEGARFRSVSVTSRAVAGAFDTILLAAVDRPANGWGSPRPGPRRRRAHRKTSSRTLNCTSSRVRFSKPKGSRWPR
jgi:allantoate deiminase